MTSGSVKQIFTSSGPWPEPMQQQQQVNVVANAGIEGDRYYNKKGFWSFRPGSYRQVTIVTEEEIARYNSLQSVRGFTPENLRRNFIVSGISLESMIGQYISIGSAELWVVRPIIFCPRLKDILDAPELAKMFNSNGWKIGAHCEIVKGGVVSSNDIVQIKLYPYPGQT